MGINMLTLLADVSSGPGRSSEWWDIHGILGYLLVAAISLIIGYLMGHSDKKEEIKKEFPFDNEYYPSTFLNSFGLDFKPCEYVEKIKENVKTSPNGIKYHYMELFNWTGEQFADVIINDMHFLKDTYISLLKLMHREMILM